MLQITSIEEIPCQQRKAWQGLLLDGRRICIQRVKSRLSISVSKSVDCHERKVIARIPFEDKSITLDKIKDMTGDIIDWTGLRN